VYFKVLQCTHVYTVFDLLFSFLCISEVLYTVNFHAMYMHYVLEYSYNYNIMWLTVHEVFTVGQSLKFSPVPNRWIVITLLCIAKLCWNLVCWCIMDPWRLWNGRNPHLIKSRMVDCAWIENVCITITWLQIAQFCWNLVDWCIIGSWSWFCD